jgi:hypothetical protein
VGNGGAACRAGTSEPGRLRSCRGGVDQQLIGGYEHLRLNNAQVGGIFREWLSLTMFEKLD